MGKNIVAVMGSYRKGGTVNAVVDEVLRAAAEAGARTEKIVLLEARVEFCTNCRFCTQEPGPRRGKCFLRDDMDGILDKLEAADVLVLGAPVNFFDINALSRRFLERMVCYVYWPWGRAAPTPRVREKTKKAVLITSSAMPAFLLRLFTGAPRALRTMAELLGARPVANLFVGPVAQKAKPEVPKKTLEKARQIGLRLALG